MRSCLRLCVGLFLSRVCWCAMACFLFGVMVFFSDGIFTVFSFVGGGFVGV